MLSDRDIAAETTRPDGTGLAGRGSLKIHNRGQGSLQPVSVDLRLGSHLRRYKLPARGSATVPVIDPRNADPALWQLIPIPDTGYVLEPGGFALGTTMEVVQLPDDIAGLAMGRSSIGRSGLAVEIAGLVDPGFQGEITMELANMAPLPMRLTTGMPIGQIVYFRTSSPVTRVYGDPALRSRYQGQQGPTAPRGKR
jgi:dCTP deaminase